MGSFFVFAQRGTCIWTLAKIYFENTKKDSFAGCVLFHCCTVCPIPLFSRVVRNLRRNTSTAPQGHKTARPVFAMKITILDGGIINPGDLQWQPITDLGETNIYPSTQPSEIAKRTAESDVVLVNRMPLDAEDVALLGPNVRLVAIMSTSTDLVDIQALEKRGIAACNVQDYSSADAAEHTLALMLNLLRRVSVHSQSVHEGEWTRLRVWSFWTDPPVCLDKKILGLVGFGAVGRRVGRLANAFGMEVLATCRTPRNPPSFAPFSFVGLDTLLQKADVVSLHCPLTRETKELICKKTIERMKDGAFLVNVSHGGLVNEKDCAKALVDGKLAGFGADVLAHEPPRRDNPLLHAPNTIITPHMAWTSRTARQRLLSLSGEIVRRWMQGTPVNLLNRVKAAPREI